MGSTATRPESAPSTPYEEHRDYVLAVLSRRCGWLDRDEREEALHEAYAVVLEKQRDGVLEPGTMPAQQLRAFLTQTAIHKGLDEGKRAGRKRSVALGEAALDQPDAARPPEDLAAAGMDSARVREIVGELPARRQAIVKLRFFFDRTPDEIQRCLSISERVYRRELERALRHIVERYELVRAGSFCDSRRSVILAFVTGIAGPTRAQAAQEHLATCRSCACWAAEVRETASRAAAVVPLPDLALPQGPGERLLHTAAAVREQVAEAGTAAKQHLLAVATKVDPASAGYASSARPGAVAMAVAGCVAVGSGATYCAIDGVPDPVRGFAEAVGVHEAKEHKGKRAPSRPRSATGAQAREAPVVPPPVARPTTPEPPPVPQPDSQPAAPEPTPPPAAVEEEFGLEQQVQPASPPPTSPSAEFGP